MTGFGRAEKNIGEKTFLVDIKSLNGKQFELSLKLPAILKPYEFDIRRILSEHLGRGSVDCMISLKDTGDAKPVTINVDLARAYYKPLAELSESLNLDPSNILSTLVKLPEVITPSSDTLSSADWQARMDLCNASKPAEHPAFTGNVIGYDADLAKTDADHRKAWRTGRAFISCMSSD